MDLQRDVERFLRHHGLQHDAAAHVLDLVSEVGEVAKLVLEASDYGGRPLDRGVDFSDELGDVLYSVLALATALDVDAEEALHAALRKYERRLEKRGGAGSA